MSRSHSFSLALLAVLLELLGSAPLMAQQSGGIRPGGSARGSTRAGATTGAATNRGNTGTSSASSTGARQYRSNTLLGDAIISIDPETRALIIVTDEDTHRELTRVIRELDRPKPQVLIKVVFL